MKLAVRQIRFIINEVLGQTGSINSLADLQSGDVVSTPDGKLTLVRNTSKKQSTIVDYIFSSEDGSETMPVSSRFDAFDDFKKTAIGDVVNKRNVPHDMKGTTWIMKGNCVFPIATWRCDVEGEKRAQFVTFFEDCRVNGELTDEEIQMALGDFLNDYKSFFKIYNIEDCSVEQSSPLPNAAVGSENFTKFQLIPYVIVKNGPMDRDQILKAVAEIEGKPYVPTSNKSYFGASENSIDAKQSVVVRGLIVPAGKVGGKIVYNVTSKGIMAAAEVQKALG